MTDAEQEQFDLSRDSEVFFTGTHNECFAKLLYSQRNSVDWAMRHDGYTITKKEK